MKTARILLIGLFPLIAATNSHAQSNKPNLKPYKPSAWSAPLVVSLNRDGDTIVSWAVANSGSADASRYFYTALDIDGNQVKRWKTTSLSNGYYTAVESYNAGRLTSGSHGLRLTTDSTGRISESSEGDNSHSMTFTIEDDDVLLWPLPSNRTTITQSFGDDWSANSAKRHTGIDIAAPKNTRVYAAKGGKVSKTGSLGGTWGDYVILSHDNDTWTTCYLHVTSSLKRGDEVEAGDSIGRVHTDHLHFSIRLAPTSSISPRGALPKRADGSSDPLFPESFVDPEDYDFESDN